MLTVYGLKTCDTCRKALKWLAEHSIAHEVFDVRADGVTEALIEGWLKEQDPAALINKASTTWRQLTEQEKADVETAPAKGLAAHPTLIKRPVFVDPTGAVLAIGFKQNQQDALKALV